MEFTAKPLASQLIIPMHMMNREIIPAGKEGMTMSSINCDSC